MTVGLVNYVSGHCALQVLRTYWYDAARDGVPTPEHLAIGALPNVKLRLGRLSGGQQKGVDALIYRDLMTLARERAMATAYVLAGDEDLREGVSAAQDIGVRVVLLGIPAVKGHNQSQHLIREADDYVVLGRDFWTRHFTRRPDTTPRPVTVPAATSSATPSPSPAKPESSARVASPAETIGAARKAGADFALSWASQVTPDEIARLLAHKPRIAPEADIQLIRFAERTVGPLRNQQDLRVAVRRAFWDALSAAAAQRAEGAATRDAVPPPTG